MNAVDAAATAAFRMLIPNSIFPDPIPPHGERVRLFHNFRHSHMWSFQRAIAFAVMLRGGVKGFDFANHCVCVDVCYRLGCDGNPSLAYSVLDVNINPLADILAQCPAVEEVMLSSKPALDDIISLRKKTVPGFAGFIPSVYHWTEFGGYFIEHPTPLHHHPEIELRAPYMRACHEWKEDLQKATQTGVVYQQLEEQGRWKAGHLKKERSKWRWHEFTPKEMEEHGMSADFPGHVF